MLCWGPEGRQQRHYQNQLSWCSRRTRRWWQSLLNDDVGSLAGILAVRQELLLFNITSKMDCCGPLNILQQKYEIRYRPVSVEVVWSSVGFLSWGGRHVDGWIIGWLDNSTLLMFWYDLAKQWMVMADAESNRTLLLRLCCFSNRYIVI